MSSYNCKAITQSGENCKLKANSSGYCHIHDPERISTREAQKQYFESLNFEIPAKRFSERRGLKSVSEIIQVDTMTQELRNSLWNILSVNFLLRYKESSSFDYISYQGRYVDEFTTYLWREYFKHPLDHRPQNNREIVKYILDYFQKCEWYEVYDFLEVVIGYFSSPSLVNEVNSILEKELSGYRFVGGVFTDITSDQEIEMLEQAVNDTDFPAVSSHLKRALTLMSDKNNPDYRNSIKEAISAVESLAKAITGKPKATLGAILFK